MPVAFLHWANEEFQRIIGAGQLRFFAIDKQPRGKRLRLLPDTTWKVIGLAGKKGEDKRVT
jgi:hypothetical protein